MKIQGSSSELKEAVFNVSGMWCASCAQALEKKVTSCRGVGRAKVDFVTSQLWVEYSSIPSEIDLESLARSIGYRISDVFAKDNPNENSRAEITNFARIAFVFFFSMWSLLFSVTFHLDSGNKIFIYLSAIFSLPAFFVGIAPFARMSFLALKAKSLTFDFLVVTANSMLMIASVRALITNSPGVFFETVSMTLSLLLAARLADAKMRDNLKDRIYQQYEESLGFVRVLINEKWTDATARSIKEGRKIKVGPGETAFLDFRITAGNAWVNCSQVNGESVPIAKSVSDVILAGENVLEGEIEGVVMEPTGTRWIDDHVFSFAARFNRGREKSIFEKLMQYWIPLTLFGATSVATFNLANGRDFWESLTIASIVLLATCPCALALIDPVARLLARQMLLKMGINLNRYPKEVSTPGNTELFFDKTGTLTSPTFQLAKLEVFAGFHESELLHLLASASWSVQHPYSEAAVAGFKGEIDKNGSRKIVPGTGILWLRSNGQRVEVRKPSASEESKYSGFQSLVILDGKVVGGAMFRQSIAENILSSLRALKARGFRLTLVSGDRAANAPELLAAELFDETHFERNPEEKRGLVNQAKAGGRSTVFIGDGLNDIQAMAESDFSIGITGEKIQNSMLSDATVHRDHFTQINEALTSLAKMQTRKKWAYFFGFSYNFAAVWLVVVGALHPLLVVALMTLISTSMLGFLAFSGRLSQIRNFRPFSHA